MTERPDPLRARLLRAETVVGTMAFEFFTPGLVPVLEAAGCAYVILDMEHSAVSIETIKQQIAAARGLNIEPWVRISQKNYATVAGVLDAGAKGIMAPMVETVSEAEDLVAWARYRPEGRRGLAFGVGHDAYRGNDAIVRMQQSNAETVMIALLESERGIENAGAILATPGMDVGWLGHFDLTNDLGITADFTHPRFLSAVDQLVAAGKMSGKALGFADGSIERVRAFAAKGFNVLGYANDVAALRTEIARGLAQITE